MSRPSSSIARSRASTQITFRLACLRRLPGSTILEAELVFSKQDRPNLEMMVHVEGDVVDSLYESFLISWSTRLRPPLPCISTPASAVEPREYLFSDQNPYLEDIEVTKAAKAARALLRDQNEATQPEAEKRRSRLGMASSPPFYGVVCDGCANDFFGNRQAPGGFADVVMKVMERRHGTEADPGRNKATTAARIADEKEVEPRGNGMLRLFFSTRGFPKYSWKMQRGGWAVRGGSTALATVRGQ
jgi:hypothetical protein